MGSIYKKGRPSRRGYDDLSDLPHRPGEYRVRDKEGKVAYAGETNDLRRRVREHKSKGVKIQPGESVDYLIADGRSTSRTRRKHEQETIDKYQPYRNRSVGGEGRVAGRKRTQQEYNYDIPDSGGGNFFTGCLLSILKILLIPICIAAIVAIAYYGLNYRLYFIPGGILFIYILIIKFLW